MRIWTVLPGLSLTLLLAVPAAAQQQSPLVPPSVQYKDPGTATIVGVLVPGGGQMYAGEIGKGLALFGIGLGSLVTGQVMSYGSCSTTSGTCSVAPMALGALVYLGTWGYGLMDAGPAARRHNTTTGQRTVELSPAVGTPDGRPGLGLQLTFGSFWN